MTAIVKTADQAKPAKALTFPEAIPAKTPEKQKEQPLDERLHRLNELFAVQQKYNKLNDSLQKLNDFTLNKTGERIELEIQDQQRHSFNTFNEEIIAEVVDFLKSRIKAKIAQIEPQLKW